MIANDIFSDSRAVDADLMLQECLLWSRAELFDRLTSASLSQNQETLETLRLDGMSQFAEFFYLIRARRIETTDQIAQLAEIHNEHIELLCKDIPKMKRLGLRKDRLLDAIFTSDTMPRLMEIWKLHPGRVDQSNLARFLATTMSTETCRKIVVASADAGFLSRSKSAFGSVLVQSTGIVEQVFGGVLRDLRRRLMSIHFDANEG
jgi:hypothetical protein